MAFSSLLSRFRKTPKALEPHPSEGVSEISVFATPAFFDLAACALYRTPLNDRSRGHRQLPAGASDQDLGEAVRFCLARSHSATLEEHHLLWDRAASDYEDWVKATMAEFGFKDRSRLFKDMKYVSVTAHHGQITFTPWRRERGEAFSGKGIDETDCIVRSAQGDSDQIGRDLRLALERCR